MTEQLIAPVIPPGPGPARGRPGRAGVARPCRWPDRSLSRWTVYGMCRIDASGRLTSQAISHVLNWQPGDRLTLTAGTRRAYGSYWNRIVEHWGERRLDEPSPSGIRQLMTWVKTHVVARRNARGGRSAQEHLVAALRCLYRRAVEDGLIAEAENPAQKVAKRPPADHPAGA